ncbi:uncharacterized protein E0L32_010969 [Thyridium curvatum]|uniref:ABC transporter domain-containing protein n=1 Tax=Thyridium curvatum TaxID=1093900 RepID=A0A507ALP4_9PEZI|nr:uncharacterized protein E0L32_010969 [Thyridium curvatum]TPX07074.1 hypothetical protein E0L32_010969 [Thyridium curvatum]
MAFLRQTGTLVRKNFLIVCWRHAFPTFIRAFILPIILMAFFTFARNLFVPPALFGIGDSRPVKSLPDALSYASGSGRDTVAFVNNGLAGGQIDSVINVLAGVVEGAGAKVRRLRVSQELDTVCRSSLRGVTSCYGAVVFQGSPTEGEGRIWNYTIRNDGALGLGKIDVDKGTNDGQIYMLPFQHAIDAAITGMDPTADKPVLPNTTHEYPYTTLTVQERADKIRVQYQNSLTNFLAVAFVSGVIGVCYHSVGFMATEREIGMATLIEAMMPTRRRWQAQASRLLSYHISFSLIYLPGWVVGSLIVARGVFAHTNVGIVLIYHILVGLAFVSMSLFGGAFFKKSQLSGVTVTLIYLLLAIVAQTVSYPKTATVAVLSFLFAPCNYTYFITYLARFERQQVGTNLLKVGKDSPWNVPGLALWIFLIVQIIAYPIIGAFIEQYLYGTSSHGRTIVFEGESGHEGLDEAAVKLDGFTKVYKPGFIRRMFSFISKPKPPVYAVNGLTLSAGRGQILALLGANGSGKSTTLDSIAGTNRLTSGSITIDGTGGLGIAPQKNVLWDEVTVEEHVLIFNKLKSPGQVASRAEILELIASVDLDRKVKAQSKTLSGGQKRKLQLGMMLTGGSAVCCVDEVSSGLDPLSRRKIWDILLAERGRRTMILTTHFLDEADLLADHIAVLSKGTLKAAASSVELKDRLGGGYRIHVHKTKALVDGPPVEGVFKKNSFDVITYIAPSSRLAAEVIKTLEREGIHDYRFSGPTIEDVFLQLAEEVKDQSNPSSSDGPPIGGAGAAAAIGTEKGGAALEDVRVTDEKQDDLELLSGQRIGYVRQAWVLFLKRCVIFKHNWVPYFAAFIIPVIAAGLVTLFVRDQTPPGCTPSQQGTEEKPQSFLTNDFGGSIFFVAGPPSQFSPTKLIDLFLPAFGGASAGSGNSTNGAAAGGLARIANNITFANTYEEFQNLIVRDRKKVTPAGWWLGDANSPPTVAYKANYLDTVNAFFGQTLLDMMLTNTSIAATYAPFNIPWAPDTGKSLQLLVYIGLALCAYPGFFALYPNLERRRNVRGLEYSNGVRVFPLWAAYVAFDFAIVILSSALAVILFAALSKVWYHVGYLFLVFALYGLAMTLQAYLISLFSRNQLSAYAFTAAGQAVLFLVYLIAYLCTITYAPVNKVDNYLLLVHFLVSAFAPIGSVIRSMFLALNLFSATCVGDQIAPNPGGILQYGGPILYLIVQSVLFFLLLLVCDSGKAKFWFARLFSRRSKKNSANDDAGPQDGADAEIANELVRVTSSVRGSTTEPLDGLRAVHLSKTFGKNTAVDNVTFGIKRGEVFALLGPNGAGKSTTISMIRGDLQPDSGGDVFVENVSVSRRLAAARAHLGVCPQFDAVDQMTVREHLRFYARVRGIPDVEHNVRAVTRAVGLQAFRDRQAHALSGGNKRKLSLGIALMGNPSVVLLDEPSSGLDAAAKRVMWRTLAATVPGRSILLTTHSMEEADALAGRAGIMAKRMLAMGTVDQLRARFGDRLHVHLVCKGAPRTSDADVARVRAWVGAAFPGAEMEDKTYHGQMRFSIPAREVVLARSGGAASRRAEGGVEGRGGGGGGKGGESSVATVQEQSAIGQLVVLLEEERERLGVEHYSVSPTTLDQVFLTVVGRHNVVEEGYQAAHEGEDKKKGWFRRRKVK